MRRLKLGDLSMRDLPIMSDCNHYWMPIYYPPERLPPSRPVAQCSMCGALKPDFGPQSSPQKGVEHGR